jgi:hypothetical protein
LIERQYVTDAGGQPATDSLDVFINQQIWWDNKETVANCKVHHRASQSAAKGSCQDKSDMTDTKSRNDYQ